MYILELASENIVKGLKNKFQNVFQEK